MSFDLATGLATETQYRSSTYPGTEAPFVKPVARTTPDSSALSIRGVLMRCTECGDIWLALPCDRLTAQLLIAVFSYLHLYSLDYSYSIQSCKLSMRRIELSCGRQRPERHRDRGRVYLKRLPEAKLHTWQRVYCSER